MAESKRVYAYHEAGHAIMMLELEVVPGIGPVAYLTSVNGETNEVFTQASSYMRLKFFGKSKPGS